MSLLLPASILLRVIAFAWSLVLWRRERDWRVALLSLMLALMAMRQAITMAQVLQELHTFDLLHLEPAEVPALLVSVLALAAIGFLGRLLAESRAATAEISRQEARFRTLVEHAPEAIVVLDIDSGRFVDLNANALALFGLDRATMLAKGPTDLSPSHQPDRRPSESAARAALEEAAAGGAPLFEWVHLDAGGREIPCEIRLVRIPSAGPERLVRGSITDISERKQAERRQRLLMRELDHRVKNNLAAVIALAEQTIESTASVDEFRRAFTGRLRALARSHEALAAARWEGVALEEIVRLSLGAPSGGRAQPYEIDGEPIVLPARASSPLGMALHELNTNALKHGSLSTASGWVELRWTRTPDDRLELIWREHDGPPANAPGGTGLGLALVQGVIEHELSGRVHVDFRPEGLECRISVPLTELTARAPGDTLPGDARVGGPNG